MSEEPSDLETAFKVVAIMQTITEELDESGKRAWRKMLGISTRPTKEPSSIEKNLEQLESDNE